MSISRVLILLALLWPVSGVAIPNITAPVNDPDGYLSTQTRRELSAAMIEHREATGVQMAVLVVRTTHGTPIDMFSHEVAVSWGGGSAERDDGLLFVLAVEDRRMRIETGYGLEGLVSDSRAQTILAGIKIDLRAEKYGAAAKKVVRELIGATADLTAQDIALRSVRPDGKFALGFLILTVFCLAIIVVAWRKLRSTVPRLGALLFALLIVATIGGDQGTSWAILGAGCFGLGWFLLTSLFPTWLAIESAATINEAPDPDAKDPAPMFIRGSILFCWLTLPMFYWLNPSEFLPRSNEAFNHGVWIFSCVLLGGVLLGIVLHVARLFGTAMGSSGGRGGGGGVVIIGGSDWGSSTWSSSDWSSSSDWGGGSDWSGGGGGWGGGGASDSW